MKRFTYLFTLILVTVALAGCGSWWKKKPPEVPPLVDTTKKVEVDPRLLKECEDLEKLKGPHDTEVLTTNKQWLDAHKACANNNKALIKVVKKAFNLEK